MSGKWIVELKPEDWQYIDYLKNERGDKSIAETLSYIIESFKFSCHG